MCLLGGWVDVGGRSILSLVGYIVREATRVGENTSVQPSRREIVGRKQSQTEREPGPAWTAVYRWGDRDIVQRRRIE